MADRDYGKERDYIEQRALDLAEVSMMDAGGTLSPIAKAYVQLGIRATHITYLEMEEGK